MTVLPATPAAGPMEGLVEALAGKPDWSVPRLAPTGAALAVIATAEDAPAIWLRRPGQPFGPVATFAGARLNDYHWAVRGDALLALVNHAGADESRRLYEVPLSGEPHRLVSPAWAHDSRLLAQTVDGRLFVLARRPGGSGFQLVEVSADRRSSRPVNGPGDAVSWVVSRCGQRMLAVVRDDQQRLVWWVRPAAAADWRVVPAPIGPDALAGRPLGFHPDDGGEGRSGDVYGLSPLDGPTTSLVTIEPETGCRRILSGGHPADITQVLFGSDGRPLAVRLADAAERYLGLTPSAVAQLDAMTAGLPDGVATFRIASQNADHWVVDAHFLDAAPAYHLFDRRRGALAQLFPRYVALAGSRVRRREPFTTTAGDGLPLHGFLTRPTGTAPPWPTVLVVHGGPWTRDRAGFDPLAQWLAGLGYLAVQVNYRGSTGRGRRFLDAGDREWGGLMQTDLADTVDHFVDRKLADPVRVAVMGESYGGYAALVAAAWTRPSISCVVAVSAPTDLVTFLEWTATSGRPVVGEYRRRIGDVQSDRERLARRSPVALAPQIAVPVLLVHGARDARVPVEQAHRFAAVLGAAGNRPELVVYEDEGHRISRPANRRAHLDRVAAFLHAHLSRPNASDPAPRR